MSEETLTEKLWDTSWASSSPLASFSALTNSLYGTSLPSLASEFSATQTQYFLVFAMSCHIGTDFLSQQSAAWRAYVYRNQHCTNVCCKANGCQSSDQTSKGFVSKYSACNALDAFATRMQDQVLMLRLLFYTIFGRVRLTGLQHFTCVGMQTFRVVLQGSQCMPEDWPCIVRSIKLVAFVTLTLSLCSGVRWDIQPPAKSVFCKSKACLRFQLLLTQHADCSSLWKHLLQQQRLFSLSISAYATRLLHQIAPQWLSFQVHKWASLINNWTRVRHQPCCCSWWASVQATDPSNLRSILSTILWISYWNLTIVWHGQWAAKQLHLCEGQCSLSASRMC